MGDYSEGKIYKIWSPSTELVYIGSTVKTLKARFGGHRRSYNQFKNGTKGWTTSFSILEFGDAQIELIELFPCKTKKELLDREGYWIGEMQCVNKCMAGNYLGKTGEEYRREYYQNNMEKVKEKNKECYQANREKTLIRLKEYREANPEKVRERQKKYYEANPEKVKERQKRYAEANKEKIREYQKKYDEENKERIREKDRQFYLENQEKFAEYREANRERAKQYSREYYKANREKLREKVKCECGMEVSKRSLKSHRETSRHLNSI